ncbi:EAL domain-containing protein [Psychrobium sp. 1_MG-2023]|uniref:bifunctional diguanylate cyclase/phosphodiesterase n=1 Tax=Psychrobium sp. 1_MG-2023 TaxID=3062624 RepID=UPI000C3367EB|nr:EAL domain-containing protein [Psychrobium sp. 1_MG-2023]MDP2560340.1 EAL domain-containing protein [Psychrobium sp. 1_MG-2023]PKF55451.1 hypothetical protein CW748_13220 [Alteromonadales bacterium alter-6D02]
MKQHAKTAGISLRTQLYGLVIGIALVTLIGSLWISIENTRSYLNEQMETHAQDTATSLGLSISPYMNEEDAVIVETMVSAIFDSGYYKLLTLTDVNGNVILERNNPTFVDGVPQWFIETFTLSPPIMQTEVNNGWNIAGVLALQSHPGISYDKLWQQSVNSTYSGLIICFIALFLAHLILREVLLPLSQVEKQAQAVCRKQFPIIANLPMTRELKAVVTAMNTMVSNIQTTFDQMSKHAEKLTHDAFIDHLTNLGNRRSFENQFDADNQEMNLNDSATLGMIQLPSLSKINNELGYKAGDEYVCLTAELVQQHLQAFGGAKLFRTGGGCFFFMIKDTSQDVLHMCERLQEQFSALCSKGYPEGFAEIIATSYSKKDNLSSLLAKLDTLLTQEGSATKEGIVYSTHHSHDIHGLHEWSDLIDNLVQSNDVKFSFQPVLASSQSEVIYYELFSQFYFDEQSIANNQLFAMAERLNKSQELDKMVLTSLSMHEKFSSETKLAINLTHQSVHDINFRNWLAKFCEKHAKNLPHLVFEINEDAILASIESSQDFIQMIKRYDIEICIERFGSSFTSFKYLKGLDVDFLKIDGSYIRDLDKHPENNYFIQAVTQIAHGVGIKVLSSHVETVNSLELLKDLHCDGMQGNHIQQTFALVSNNLSSTCKYSPLQLESSQ